MSGCIPPVGGLFSCAPPAGGPPGRAPSVGGSPRPAASSPIPAAPRSLRSAALAVGGSIQS
eukprot:1919327-Pyramimonas_sp.AAC.1